MSDQVVRIRPYVALKRETFDTTLVELWGLLNLPPDTQWRDSAAQRELVCYILETTNWRRLMALMRHRFPRDVSEMAWVLGVVALEVGAQLGWVIRGFITLALHGHPGTAGWPFNLHPDAPAEIQQMRSLMQSLTALPQVELDYTEQSDTSLEPHSGSDPLF